MGAGLYIGTYRRRGGRGLYPLTADGLGLAYEGAPNASFGVSDRARGLHYLVEEDDPGAVSVHRRGEDGWRRLARLPTFGGCPCHLALAPDRSALAVANYKSGEVSFLTLGPHGLPQGPPALFANSGAGPDRERQDGPHAHWVGFAPDGRWLYQTDLGTDEIRAFPLGSEGLGPPRTAFRAPPGSGPRHLALHPGRALAFLVCELSSSLVVLERSEGALSPIQTLSTLPHGHTGKSLGGHIGLNAAADRLYVSNRGHDSIAVFAVEDGGLRSLHHAPTGGASPRFFLLLEDEGRMLVANEEGDRLTSLGIRPDGGLVLRQEVVEAPAPVFTLRA